MSEASAKHQQSASKAPAKHRKKNQKSISKVSAKHLKCITVKAHIR
jgi:hypothetical protein